MPQVVVSKGWRQAGHGLAGFVEGPLQRARRELVAPLVEQQPLPLARKVFTWADSSNARLRGIGTPVLDISVLSGSAGYWTAGCTTPRLTLTSPTRSPHVSASRHPTEAPSRIAGPRCGGMAPHSAETCPVVGTYGRCLPF